MKKTLLIILIVEIFTILFIWALMEPVIYEGQNPLAQMIYDMKYIFGVVR